MKQTIYYNTHAAGPGPYTRIIACACIGYPDDSNKWAVRDESILDGLTKLYRQGDNTYYGHL